MVLLIRRILTNAVACRDVAHGQELALRRMLPKRVFFFGHLDKRLDGKSEISKSGVGRLTESQFRLLSEAIAERLKPKPKVYPVYHDKHLGFAVQGAARDFHQRWLALLGFEPRAVYHKAKWQTVKALTRRLANRWADQFSGLMPVADLIECLQERLRSFLSQPIGWIDSEKKAVPMDEVDDKARDDAVEGIVTAVHTRLHKLAPERLLAAQLGEWAAAYGRSGQGFNRRAGAGHARHLRPCRPDSLRIRRPRSDGIPRSRRADG